MIILAIAHPPAPIELVCCGMSISGGPVLRLATISGFFRITAQQKAVHFGLQVVDLICFRRSIARAFRHRWFEIS